MRIRRHVFPAIILLSALLPAAGARSAVQDTDARFDVQALGLKVGELQMTGNIDTRGYRVAARFATTGLARLFRDMGFSMRTDGVRDGQDLKPRQYAEEVNTGNRISTATMRYDNGTPVLVSGNVSDGEVEPLDPAGETGTVDPLTVLFEVMRDQPAENLCRTDRMVFDGGRRTRIILTGGTRKGDIVTCSGQFRRIAGYPQADLEKKPVVPLTISYAPGEDGMMQAQSALLRTSYGPVGLARQP